jgi:hypothetical protein
MIDLLIIHSLDMLGTQARIGPAQRYHPAAEFLQELFDKNGGYTSRSASGDNHRI